MRTPNTAATHGAACSTGEPYASFGCAGKAKTNPTVAQPT